MGLTFSCSRSTIDGGHSIPQNKLYSNPDYDPKVVKNLVCKRKLAPFYANKEQDSNLNHKLSKPFPLNKSTKNIISDPLPDSFLTFSPETLPKDPPEPFIECPICFLLHPMNINRSTCCKKPICTECFTNLKYTILNEPPCCPFCNRQDFSICYNQSKITPIDIRPAFEKYLKSHPVTINQSMISSNAERSHDQDEAIRESARRTALIVERLNIHIGTRVSRPHSFHPVQGNIEIDINELMFQQALRESIHDY